jgi:hypothetical protein
MILHLGGEDREIRFNNITRFSLLKLFGADLNSDIDEVESKLSQYATDNFAIFIGYVAYAGLQTSAQMKLQKFDVTLEQVIEWVAEAPMEVMAQIMTGYNDAFLKIPAELNKGGNGTKKK